MVLHNWALLCALIALCSALGEGMVTLRTRLSYLHCMQCMCTLLLLLRLQRALKGWTALLAG